MQRATGFDDTPLDAQPTTRGITNGVVMALYVREQPWGLLEVVSHDLKRRDAPALALFAAHVIAQRDDIAVPVPSPDNRIGVFRDGLAVGRHGGFLGMLRWRRRAGCKGNP